MVKESEFNTLLRTAGITTGTDTVGEASVGYVSGGLDKMEGLPYAFGRFGDVNGTMFTYLARNGFYWSGTAVSSSRAYDLHYYTSELHPASQNNRNIGRSVRCLAR